MRITSRKPALSGLAALGVVALFAGCAPAPEEGGDTKAPVVSDFLPCMVSDAGGFDDKSFNQLGYEGLVKAADELGVKEKHVESATATDFKPNLTSLVDQGCNLIITVGFALAEATAESAKANPDINYVSIDDTIDLDFDGKTDVPNVKPIVFDTAQAAFLAGYLSAGVSETGKVGTYGGMQFPTVTIFMDGLAQGVAHYNKEKGAKVEVVGWNTETQKGVFSGTFSAGTQPLTDAQNLIDAGVDVLLPVGGPIYQSAAAAIRDSGKEIALIGVDADVFVTDPSVADLLLTSVLKGIDVGVEEAVLKAGRDEFDVTPFVGTLENDGVGLAEFHDWADKVPAELQDELDKLREDIISGDVKVTSYLAG
ncbi:nucleoside-binding protein [Cryobacterium psychrotolerans]|uniref:Nucleoside-binding protein n=1 Tax=Cryobacterium psychrotolerans TaxID=386301 RepID=A0A1G9CQV1_9MICO|nr:BMP family ABC transporter substrate-binding protein [Cryobacterium psychrotolerans]TFD84216.1 BMP family ABC transporter substrate-binding protein [Cryobacterium psychrotolerans]SDK53815.1 nucleoside-binding protein [Cryobacterium psychrotolerans]